MVRHGSRQRGRQPMRSPSTVMLTKTSAISSVVPSPQLTARGGLLGWRRLSGELSNTATISMRVPAGKGTGSANV